jgi:solute:Na+ symporter, SSS family
LLYAGVPVLLGIVARARFSDLADADMALPAVLMYGVPPLVGAIGLAAVFSAEVSAADAVLFMLTTSLSQDLYKRFLNPEADDRRVLSFARWATIVSGCAGVALAIVSAGVIEVLTIFYSLLVVSLFVPILAGLYSTRASSAEALVSIVCGVGVMLLAQAAGGNAGIAGLTPAIAGLLAAVAGFAIVFVSRRGHDRVG